ncbi:MAG: glycerol-3-phosphate responsive antiterminator [Clostridiaceae bacterium]|nr:glycerol-3-phosphate responsive antiterminator [Eubacteriales bacterium]
MDQAFFDAVGQSPVIAAAKDEQGLERCLELDDIRIVFLLFGNIVNIGELVRRAKAKDKLALVHADLVEGLSNREIAVDFLKKCTEADGILSTRPNLIRRARELHMCTVLRVFLIDSMALANVVSYDAARPDFIEIMPGISPPAIKKVCAAIKTPVLAGGLISSKDDVIRALEAGAMAVSTTNREVWRM